MPGLAVALSLTQETSAVGPAPPYRADGRSPLCGNDGRPAFTTMRLGNPAMGHKWGMSIGVTLTPTRLTGRLPICRHRQERAPESAGRSREPDHHWMENAVARPARATRHPLQ